MRIQRLSAASYKFFSPGGVRVMLDPWLTRDPMWPLAERTAGKLAEIDVIAITHAHVDHASGVGEIQEHNETVSVIAQAEYAAVLAGRGVRNVIAMNIGGTVHFRGVSFSMVSAAHSSSETDRERKTHLYGPAVGYVMEFEDGLRVYASGDTGFTAEMKLLIGDYYKPDVSILPVTGVFAMEPELAAYAASLIGSKCVIASHDFPSDPSTAADPEGCVKMLRHLPVPDTFESIARFTRIMKERHPEIEVVYIPIGGTAEVGPAAAPRG